MGGLRVSLLGVVLCSIVVCTDVKAASESEENLEIPSMDNLPVINLQNTGDDSKEPEILTCEKQGNNDCGANNQSCEDQDSKDYKCVDCKEGSVADGKGGCRETCDPGTEGDCLYNGTCNAYKFCDCEKGFSGDKCSIIDECKTGKYENCTEPHTCLVDSHGNIKCECAEGTFFDDEQNICRKKCINENDCNNGNCTDRKFCQCDEGYIGDTCDVIEDCVSLKEKCDKASATCKFNRTTKEAYCDCNDYNYDFLNDNCETAKWCNPDPCSKDAKCVFENGIGSCNCSSTDQYYDFRLGGCQKIDPCLSMKSCGENKVCDSKNGQCICKDGFQPDGESCKRKTACAASSCFVGATCIEGDQPNTVKCSCKDNEFYKDKCLDGGCFIPGNNCSKSCPIGTKKIGNVCEPVEDKKCDKSCGFGWCIKDGNTDKCVCKDSDYTVSKEGVCVLRSTVCPKGMMGEDSLTCNCTGMYKMAVNEISCEKKSCADEDARKDCEGKKANCVDNWRNPNKAYECKCEKGYGFHPETGICTDLCSYPNTKNTCAINKQVCYLTNSDKLDCKCSPTFTLEESANGKRCEPTELDVDVMLHSLPVKSDRYLKKGSIDYIKLNKDIIDAMEAIFPKKELQSARLYKYKLRDSNILCEVWLQFKEDAPTTVDRWKVAITSVNDTVFLAPALVLSSEKEANEVVSETLKFCSTKDTHCGQYTRCTEKKCSCLPGFKAIESTIAKYKDFLSLYCEDIDECVEENECSQNTTCQNTLGSYYCKCKEGFKKTEGPADAEYKAPCTDLCSPSPCGNGKCQIIKNVTVDCTCDPGYGGSFCDKEDFNFKSARKNTVVVGAVLGTLLGVLVLLIAFYIFRQRKNSYSEDFTPSPRIDNAEMVDRRPMRGVTNRAYQ